MQRREFTFLSATAAAAVGLPHLAFAQTRIVTDTFGGTGGVKQFDGIVPNSFGLRYGSRVDALFLNGKRYGEGGGEPTREHTLVNGEYWKKFAVRHGSEVDYLEMSTNRDLTVKGGGSQGKFFASPDNIRVLSMSGEHGARLDKLRIEYLTDFHPSNIFTERVPIVYDILGAGQQVQEFVQETKRRLDAFTRVVETSQSVTAAIEVELKEQAEVGLKSAKGSAEVTNTRKTREEVLQEMEEELKRSRTQITTVNEGSLGVLYGEANVMRSSDGSLWLLPTSGARWRVISLANSSALRGSILLTSGLNLLAPNLSEGTLHGFRSIK